MKIFKPASLFFMVQVGELSIAHSAALKIAPGCARIGCSFISVAIDDFGTGYSSLYFLKRFPIDILKIDKSFVGNIFANPDDACIVDAVIALGHNMRMQIIAEGIETEQQLLFLKQRKCDIGQGFYFSKPLTAEHMTAFLHSGPGGGEMAIPTCFPG